MKKNITRLLSAALTLMAVAMLASCLKDDTKTLTEEELMQAVAEMAGDYTGSVIVGMQTAYGTMPIDTIENITWHSDTILTIDNFPVATLANAVTGRPELQTAIKDAQKSLTLKNGYGFSAHQAKAENFFLYPENIKLNLHYGDADHTVEFGFYQGPGNYGTFNGDKQYFVLNLNGMAIDGQLVEAVNIRTLGFYFSSDKKQ